jgi:hypothetical protein
MIALKAMRVESDPLHSLDPLSAFPAIHSQYFTENLRSRGTPAALLLRVTPA